MSRRSRLCAVAVLALGALALLHGLAAARTAIRLQPAGEIKKVVEGFTVTAFGGEVRIICRLTMTGTIVNVIEKASAGLLPAGRIGQIESAATEGCRTNFGTGAEVTVLVEAGAPIPLRYQAFLGVLPGITGILFRKLGFSFQVVEPMFLGTCLYRGMVSLLMALPPVEGGGGRRFNPEAFVTPNAIPRFAGLMCPETVEVSGAGGITPPQGGILVE
jgi:hypothetical protein